MLVATVLRATSAAISSPVTSTGSAVALDARIRTTVVGTAARAAAWGKIDETLVDQAVAVPWIFDKQPNIESANVRGINDLWDVGEWDYTYTSLKNP